MSEPDTYSILSEPGLRPNRYTPEELREIVSQYLPVAAAPESLFPVPCDPYAKPQTKERPAACNIRMGEDGLHARIPFPNALPQIRISFRDGNTTFTFTGSYEGRHSLPAKLLRQMENDPGTEVGY